MIKNKLFQSLTFFVIAFGLTFLLDKYLPEISYLGIQIKLILVGLGPLLSGLICYKIFETKNEYQITLHGIRPIITYSIIAIAVLLPLFLIKKVSKETIIISIITQFIYSFGEEFGWRHYLLNLTKGMNK